MGAAVMPELSDAEVFGGAPAGDLAGYAAAMARKHGVRPELVLAQMKQESGGNPGAVSPKGARGPMQLMPDTAAGLGVDPGNPYQNIEGGVRYLRQQIDAHGGDERLALAAYNAGPGAVQKHGGVPPYPETQGYVRNILANAPAPAQGEMSDAEVFGQGAGDTVTVGRSHNGGVTVELPRSVVFPPPKNLRPDNVLGFEKGVVKPLDNAAGGLEWLAGKVGLDKPINALGDVLGMPTLAETQSDRQAALDRAAAQGRRPGMLGEFAGNMVGTLPLGALKGGALIQGALGGAALSDAKDAKGLARDAALGGAVGRLTALGSDALQVGARKLLSKAPQIPTLPQLKTMTSDAYKALDAAGFRFARSDVAGMVDDFAKTVGGSALSKTAKEDAQSIINYARGLSKSDVSLSQLEKLRGDIYDAMVKKGGDTGRIGKAFRSRIDEMMDAVPDNSVREARALNARMKKTEYVTNMSKSADRNAERTYGGDYGRKVKDRLNPLVDEAMPNKNLRGGTPDELALIDRIVRGTKTQNVASTVGGMLDPRRMGGKILTGITAPGAGVGAGPTGGLSLLVPALQMATGFGLTGAASKIARKNVDELIKLMAAGGSRQALSRVPTQASYLAEQGIRALRPTLVAASAPAIAAARRDPKTKTKK